MMSEKALRRELKRYPGFIRRASADKNYDYAYKLSVEAELYQMILEETE